MDEFLYLAIFLPPGAVPPPRTVTSLPELAIYIRDFGTRPGDHGFVAESNGEIVGMAWARLIRDFGYIDDATPSVAISLKESWRGKGVGTRLLRALTGEMKSAGFRHASLSVQKENRPALRLYRKAGFEPFRETDEEWIMRIHLYQDEAVGSEESGANPLRATPAPPRAARRPREPLRRR